MTKHDFINRGSGVALEFTPPNLSFHFAKMSVCYKNYIASYNTSNHLNFYTMSFLWPKQACTCVDEKFLSLRKNETLQKNVSR